MLRLILVRHGQSIADIDGRHEGRADFQLTELGIEQANLAAQYLFKHYEIDKIYCSPLKRAKKTAEIIASMVGRVPKMVEDLMERNNGEIAGLTYAEAKKKFPLFVDNIEIYKPLPGGESLIDFRMRIENFWHKFIHEELETEIERTVCIVAHSGTISMLFKAILELSINTKANFPTADTGIHEIEIAETSIKVLKGNSVEHL